MGHIDQPKVKLPREAQQEVFLRNLEINPAKFYLPAVNRPLVLQMPSTIDMAKGVLHAKSEGVEEPVESMKKKISELEAKIKQKMQGK